MTTSEHPAEVRAAGGLVVRPRKGGKPEILAIHRPRYDDWSLPKGKLDPGEGWEEAALREVEEETGLRCALEGELEPARYTDRKGRTKLVRLWLMRPLVDHGFTPNHEVDEVRWLSPPEALELLSYEHDRRLIEAVEASVE